MEGAVRARSPETPEGSLERVGVKSWGVGGPGTSCEVCHGSTCCWSYSPPCSWTSGSSRPTQRSEGPRTRGPVDDGPTGLSETSEGDTSSSSGTKTDWTCWSVWWPSPESSWTYGDWTRTDGTGGVAGSHSNCG